MPLNIDLPPVLQSEEKFSAYMNAEEWWHREDNSRRKLTRCYIVAWEVTRGYSGPEEGGTYHDMREPLAAIPVRTHAEALEAHAKLAREFSDDYRNGPGRSSVLSGEDLSISVSDDMPHYESDYTPYC